MSHYPLTGEQTRQLHIAQRSLELNRWSFRQYSWHLSLYVFPV